MRQKLRHLFDYIAPALKLLFWAMAILVVTVLLLVWWVPWTIRDKIRTHYESRSR